MSKPSERSKNFLKRFFKNLEHRRDRCWVCGGRLSWQNDFDYEDFYGEDGGKGFVAVLDCMDCGADVLYSVKEAEDEAEESEENT